MTVREIVARVRLSVNDTHTENPRWKDEVLIGYLNDAIRDFVRLRPDLRVQNDGSLTTVNAVTAIGDTVGLPRDLMLALVNYVAEQVFSEDSAETANADRAKFHGAAWRETMIGA